jgi:hypothetical protein
VNRQVPGSGVRASARELWAGRTPRQGGSYNSCGPGEGRGPGGGGGPRRGRGRPPPRGLSGGGDAADDATPGARGRGQAPLGRQTRLGGRGRPPGVELRGLEQRGTLAPAAPAPLPAGHPRERRGHSDGRGRPALGPGPTLEGRTSHDPRPGEHDDRQPRHGRRPRVLLALSHPHRRYEPTSRNLTTAARP